MKVFLKRTLKRLIIYYVVFMLLLSNVCYGYTQAEVGDAIAGFAANVVSEYGDQVLYEQLGSYQNDGHTRDDNPIWNPGSYTWNDTSTYYFDCSSFSSGCIHAVTGLLSYSLNTTGLIGLSGDPNFEVFRFSGIGDLMPGDVVVHDDGLAHAVVYVGDQYAGEGGAIANNGSSFRDVSYFNNAYEFYVVRVSETGAANLTSLNTEFATGNYGSSSSSEQSVDLSDFYFNGIPDGKYSLAYTNIWVKIFETIAEIANYVIGFLSYIIRIPLIGWTAIIENLFNWTVNTVTGGETVSDDRGINSVEIDGADDDSRITSEKFFYNEDELTNINIFEVRD